MVAINASFRKVWMGAGERIRQLDVPHWLTTHGAAAPIGKRPFYTAGRRHGWRALGEDFCRIWSIFTSLKRRSDTKGGTGGDPPRPAITNIREEENPDGKSFCAC